MLKIGIQGDIGSTNEGACHFFAEKYGWKNFKIEYLISTENVLNQLHTGKIDYGTFAYQSSRAGLVQETQEAIQKYSFQKIDEVTLQLDHALLCLAVTEIDLSKTIKIISHPQALKEHQSFLETIFPAIEFIKTVDTALAAKSMKNGEYDFNSLVIAPVVCSKIYHLGIYLEDLPSNVGYETTIYLASVS